jgi:hypothetical protein
VKQCAVNDPGSMFCCTRHAGHGGDHIATLRPFSAQATTLAIWPQRIEPWERLQKPVEPVRHRRAINLKGGPR